MCLNHLKVGLHSYYHMFKIEHDSFTIVSVSSTYISCSSEMIPNQKHFDVSNMCGKLLFIAV